MKDDRIDARLSVVGRLPEGYVILCSQNGDEYSFLVKSLGISVECPHCGTTRCGPELAAESYGDARPADDDESGDGFTRPPWMATTVLAGPR
ncbi:MAG TPA: hypothetical protein VLV76_05850 [Candidatus Acidoferrum sp.]|nr:hypothetical protein [Candidatus Acidoferrum sp.]